MRNFVPCLRSSLLVRVAVVALISAGTAACSSDSGRFGETPFSNPFESASQAPARQPQRSDPYSTGGIQAAPSTRVERAPLSSLPAAQQRPMAGFDGQGGGAYRQSRIDPQSTGSVGAGRNYSGAPASSSGWSSQNGTMVTLGRGDSIHSISQRYGVPASAIMQANGLQNANGVGEGRQLLIPTYGSGGGSAVASTAAAARPSMGSSMMSSGALKPTRPQAMATAPVAGKPKGWETGPAPAAGRQVQAAPAETPAQGAIPIHQPKPVKVATAPVAAKPVESEQAFAAQPVKPSVGASKDADDKLKTAALKAEEPAAAAPPAGPSFRWPARGRVISAYGSKTNGSSNDGVNIAVPEGTEVKASDDGVVAYSGSELKGFGNLVLIRHSNGWVTAYAHNSALNVKRGDTVRRGQIIAKSGSTGNVTSPQLHFEVRKGAQTVDPMKHLPDA